MFRKRKKTKTILRLIEPTAAAVSTAATAAAAAAAADDDDENDEPEASRSGRPTAPEAPAAAAAQGVSRTRRSTQLNQANNNRKLFSYSDNDDSDDQDQVRVGQLLVAAARSSSRATLPKAAAPSANKRMRVVSTRSSSSHVRGLGYGGTGGHPHHLNNTAAFDRPEDDDLLLQEDYFTHRPDVDTTSTSYDKDALARLRKEQKYQSSSTRSVASSAIAPIRVGSNNNPQQDEPVAAAVAAQVVVQQGDDDLLSSSSFIPLRTTKQAKDDAPPHHYDILNDGGPQPNQDEGYGFGDGEVLAGDDAIRHTLGVGIHNGHEEEDEEEEEENQNDEDMWKTGENTSSGSNQFMARPKMDGSDNEAPKLSHYTTNNDPWGVSATSVNRDNKPKNNDDDGGGGLGGRRDRADDAAPSPAVRRGSMDQLRSQIGSTLLQIRTQQENTGRSLERRRSELVQIGQTLEKYEQDLHLAGQAHEYFQRLRQRLVVWVGAVREIRTKIEPIQTAMYELEADVAANHRWLEWENDMISVLYQHRILDRVLGRTPPSSIYDDPITAVDEFGRDVKSRFTLEREKRTRHQQHVQEQRGNNNEPALLYGDEPDAFLSEEELEALRERHVALQDALELVTDGVDHEYIVLQNLVDEFEVWHNSYPDEYQLCFSELTLVDLSIILIQTELCTLYDPWDESGGYNQAKWTAVVYQAESNGLLGTAGAERLVDKAVLRAVQQILDKSGINFLSARQMRSVRDFVSQMARLVPKDSLALPRLRKPLVAYMQQTLTSIALPILRAVVTPPRMEEADLHNLELRGAIRAATVGQMRRCMRVLVNLIQYWGPVLQPEPEFVQTILDFISNKFLFLLSSLREYSIRTEESEEFRPPVLEFSPKDAFTAVWEALLPMGWLEHEHYMLLAAPVRAAAAVYTVVQPPVTASHL